MKFSQQPANRITITIVSRTSLCKGESFTITFTVTGTFNSGNVFTAQLSDAQGNFSNAITIGSLTGTGSGTINCTVPLSIATGTGYRVRIVSSNPAFTSSDNGSNVSINPLPTPEITGEATVCSNNSYTYTASGVVGSNQWYVTGGTIIGSSNQGSVTILWGNGTIGTIKLVQTTAVGCKDSTEFNVAIKKGVATKITGNTSVTRNSQQTYTSNISNGVNYQWIVVNGTIIGSNSQQNVIVLWNNIGKGKVILNHIDVTSGCTGTDTLNVEISEVISPISITIERNKQMCRGGSVQIGSTAPASGGVPPYRYKWSPSKGLSNDAVPNPIVSPDETTEYTLTVRDARDSIATAKVVVTVNSKPTAMINGSTIVCRGVPTEYVASWVEGTYKWIVEGGTIQGSSESNIVNVIWGNNSVGVIRLILTTNAGCKDTADMNVVIMPRPEKPEIKYLGNNILLSSASQGNQWYRNGVAIPGATQQTYYAQAAGYYQVQVIIGECKSEMSDRFEMPTSVEEATDNSILTMELLPNPAIDYVEIKNGNEILNSTSRENLSIQIYNIYGECVMTVTSIGWSQLIHIDVSSLPSGVYLMRLGQQRGMFVKI